MALEEKKFLDQQGTGYLWKKIQKKLEEKANAEAVSKIDTRLTSAEGKIEALEAGTYDDTEVRGLISANTADITTLKADSTTEGSVAYQIAQIVAGADESFDTLKEIADWISSHTTSASDMNSAIKTNADDIDALEALVGDTAVATQIANALQVDGVDKYALATELTALADRVKALEDLGITAEKITNWDNEVGGYEAITSLTNDEIDAVTYVEESTSSEDAY
jgi:hypothetical protein